MKHITNESLTSMMAAYSVLKAIIQPFKKFDAYKLGLIDDKGNKIKSPETDEERKALTIADKIVINLKRIIQKTLGGSLLAKATITAYLLRESKEHPTIISEDLVESITGVIDKHYSQEVSGYTLLYKHINEDVIISEEKINDILNDYVLEWGDE